MIGEDFDVMIVDSIRKEGFYERGFTKLINLNSKEGDIKDLHNDIIYHSDSEDYITLSIISSVLFWHNVGCIPLPFPSNAFFLPPKDH